MNPPSRPTIAEDLGADFSRELERPHEVHAHVLLAVAAADREDEQRVAARGGARRAATPTKHVSQPSSFTRAVSSLTLSVGA